MNKKYIKTFESYVEGVDDEDLFRTTYYENPLSTTHDMYSFIYRDGFKELESGDYRKTIEIEKMVKITPNSEGLGNMKGLKMRAMVDTQNNKVGVIWWFKDAEDMINNKGSQDMDLYLIELIDKHKSDTNDSQGRDVFKNVKNRLKNTKKYGI